MQSKIRLIGALLSAIVIVAFGIISYNLSTGISGEKEGVEICGLGTEEDQYASLNAEFMMTRDPVTNKIPLNIHRLELQFAANLPKRNRFILSKNGQSENVEALLWYQRGPTDFGGRTRALCVDADNSANVVAGATTGGLWRSDDGAASWGIKIPPGELHSVSCMAQDTRPGHRNVYYAGTGELHGSAGVGTVFGIPARDAQYMGDGIFKSTDGGFGWDLLASTISNSPQVADSFDYIWSVAIDPSNSADDIVYAATANYGIRKSSNGGLSWNVVLGGGPTHATRTDVKVTNTGIVYAVGNSGSSMAGIWRSVAGGENWVNITPSNFPESFGRIVIGTSESNPNIVYFFVANVSGTNSSPNRSGNQFWKYTYILEDTSSTHGTWENRSANLPPNGVYVSFFTQGGYSMYISVKPDDENFVILGAASLYRSTDGFASGSNFVTIGGYKDNDYYTNLHPDMHVGYFDPNNFNIFYCGHDGGISKTLDITANSAGDEPVTWQSCNNGYITAQAFYTSLAPEYGSNYILAGFQDNHSRACNTAGISSWQIMQSGDGTFCITSPLATNAVFTSYGMSDVSRNIRNSIFAGVKITPSGVRNPYFMGPMLLEPNSGTFFLTAGNFENHAGVWRSYDPYTATPTTTWSYLPNSSITSYGLITSGYITALGMSKNSPGTLYMGTDSGRVSKILDATNTSNPSPTVIDISTGKGFPPGYITCLAVDPDNDQKVIAVFANYNVQSLWYTIDGGTSWTDIEGNLAGSSGPSCRWATILYSSVGMQVFLGTSVGLYYTNTLNGGSTIWTQESSGYIGNVVIPHIDYRPADGTLAVATHGRGIFTAQVALDHGLPVELLSFSGEFNKNKIILSWETATEVNSSGFEIEKYNGMQWLKIGYRQAAGNSNSTKPYSFTDENAKSASEKTFKYRLKMVDNDGAFGYSHVVEIANPVLRGFALSQNYPNPFNPSTKISFSIPLECNAKLEIYSSHGELIQTLTDGYLKAGEYTMNFNAEKLSSGVYIYRLTTPVYTTAKKMVLMR